jgi:RimJ/RimL family protein N-acetyltransferase
MDEPCRQTLRGARVWLRAPRESDRADRLSAGRDLAFWRMVGGTGPEPGPLTAADVDRWYVSLAAEPFGWVIEKDGCCIGAARLHRIDAAARTGRYAVGLFRAEDRSRGLGQEVTRLVLEFAFATLGLARVELRVLDFNQSAIACYQRCGFVETGREPVQLGGGAAHDVTMVAVAPPSSSAV